MFSAFDIDSKTQKPRVLVADDLPENQRFLSAVLTQAGLDVSVVANGQTAVDAAIQAAESSNAFEVILMDREMPVLDGCAAVRQLRALGYQHPIIALTASVMPGDREQCLAAGCDAFATKPITRHALLQLVGHYLANQVVGR